MKRKSKMTEFDLSNLPTKSEMMTKAEISAFFRPFNEKVLPTEFVGGLFPRRHVSIIASKAGAGKTWYLLKLFSDLSNGGTIVMQQAYYEPPRRCLLFCGETGIELISERVSQMHDKPCFENVSMVSALDVAKTGMRLFLDTLDGGNLISRLISEFKPDIVAFDTLMSFRGDDENTAQNTIDMMSRCKVIAEKHNCAIICTHHLRKSAGNKAYSQKADEEQDEIIGSSALVRNAATAFILSRNFSATKLKCVKSWWKMPEPFYFKIVESMGEIHFSIDDPYNDIAAARMRAQKYINEADHDTFTTEEIMRVCQVSRQTALDALKNTCDRTSEINRVVYYMRKKAERGTPENLDLTT